MRLGVTKDEVLALAKTMEVKFTISGPHIGGGKSGINFNPKDPRKKEVLKDGMLPQNLYLKHITELGET